MRPIKFKGQRQDGIWVYGSLVSADKGAQIHVAHHEIYAVSPETVGQFTGLFDKNRKEICEYDLLRYINDWDEIFIGVVLFHEGGLYVYNAKNDAAGYMETISYVVNSHDVEIIGNIHDNPITKN